MRTSKKFPFNHITRTYQKRIIDIIQKMTPGETWDEASERMRKRFYALEEKLFSYGEKQRLLKALGPFYAGIQSTAAVIESHSEKQGFLKGLYENFYKVYNPLAADRLGRAIAQAPHRL